MARKLKIQWSGNIPRISQCFIFFKHIFDVLNKHLAQIIYCKGIKFRAHLWKFELHSCIYIVV